MDESTDDRFYSMPRFVTHIDERAIDAYGDYLASVLPAPSDANPPRLLDLCSSWISMLPASFTRATAHVTGVGMNKQELEANPVLSAWRAHDLNADPTLSEPDASIDAVVCAVSMCVVTVSCALTAQRLSHSTTRDPRRSRPRAQARVIRPPGLLESVCRVCVARLTPTAASRRRCACAGDMPLTRARSLGDGCKSTRTSDATWSRRSCIMRPGQRTRQARFSSRSRLSRCSSGLALTILCTSCGRDGEATRCMDSHTRCNVSEAQAHCEAGASPAAQTSACGQMAKSCADAQGMSLGSVGERG